MGLPKWSSALLSDAASLDRVPGDSSGKRAAVFTAGTLFPKYLRGLLSDVHFRERPGVEREGRGGTLFLDPEVSRPIVMV